MRSLFFVVVLLSQFVVAPSALGGVFVALEKDLVDPSQGEQPTVTLSFDERYAPVLVKVVADGTGDFSKSWSWKSVTPGRDYSITWKQPPGEMEYELLVEMEGAIRGLYRGGLSLRRIGRASSGIDSPRVGRPRSACL